MSSRMEHLTISFFAVLEERGQKNLLEWCMRENLISSRYECPKCGKNMVMRERKGTIDGYEWRCRTKGGENPHDVCKSLRKGEIITYERTNDKYAIHNHVMKVFRRWIERHKGKQLFSIWILYKPVVLIVRADATKRGNQRFNRYPKPDEQCFKRFKNRDGYSPERFDVEELYAEGDFLPQNQSNSEDYPAEAHRDAFPVTDLSSRARSYISSNKSNERNTYYHSNRKYYGERKENFYHRSNSNTRGRKYEPHSYEKYCSKNQSYQDAKRQNYDSKVNNKGYCAQISNESLNEASGIISPSDKECFQNNQPECDDKYESKRQDICAGNSSNGASFDYQRKSAYRSDT
ncbi:ubiquitin domain-containing protein UBFD1 [Trichonephila clavipes]|nr:ubiquitin domain-containing protein UBFD1 [Trichonephila clavipes]